MTETNAMNIELAAHLAEIEDETIVSLVTRKKGVERGRGDEKKIYGDDLVHVLIWAGWDYENLVKLSLIALRKLHGPGKTPAGDLVKAALQAGHEISRGDAQVAIQELRSSFYTTLDKRKGNGNGSAELEPSNWEPLEVNGRRFRTLKIYKGPKTKRLTPGRVYIHALKLGQSVLEKAPNGAWVPDSSGKTIAKQLMKRRLPVGRYVSYDLDPDHTINIGADAITAARLDGVNIDPGAVLTLFKIAKVSEPIH